MINANSNYHRITSNNSPPLINPAPLKFQKKVSSTSNNCRPLIGKLIEKTFRVCGQSKNAKPEDIDCLKKNRSFKNAFDSVSGLWEKVSENVDVFDEVD